MLQGVGRINTTKYYQVWSMWMQSTIPMPLLIEIKVHLEPQKVSDSQSYRIIKWVLLEVSHLLTYRAGVTQPSWKGYPNRRVNQRNRRVRNEHSTATCYLRKTPKCAVEKRRPVEGVVPGKPDRSPAPTAQINSTRITDLDVKVDLS